MKSAGPQCSPAKSKSNQMTDNMLLELTRLERAAFDNVRRRNAEQQLGELFNEETDNEEALVTCHHSARIRDAGGRWRS
jgi:hypothetical protein